MPKNRGVVRIDFGLEIIEGLMGSGKSYHAVRRITEVIQNDRRPVYTNLPIRWRVMRKYLHNRGGQELASLIYKLDEAHWRRFLERQDTFARFVEQRKKHNPQTLPDEEVQTLGEAVGRTPERIRAQAKITSAQWRAWFQHLYGPDIYDGVDANGIPPTALIVIDEVQHWHGMNSQMTDPNKEHLQSYLTMCRHHLHWIWVITQDSSRIAKVFRLLAKYTWKVWDRGEDRLFWGIRLKHFGIRAQGYSMYTPEQLEGRNFDNREPSKTYTILTQRPKNRVFYRLYDSFTHIEDARSLQRTQQQERIRAGLSEHGTTNTEAQTQQETDMPKKKPFVYRLTRRLIRYTVTATLLYVAFIAGKQITPPTETQDNEQTIVENKPIVWPAWNAAGRTPYFNGAPVQVGEDISDRAKLVYYAPDRRSVVLLADDAWWVWRYTDREPKRVGDLEQVRTAVSKLRESEATDTAER